MHYRKQKQMRNYKRWKLKTMEWPMTTKVSTASDLPMPGKDLHIVAELKGRERVVAQFSTDRPLWDSRPTQWTRFIRLHSGTAGRREPYKCTQTLSQQLSWTIGQQEMEASFWLAFSLLSCLRDQPQGRLGEIHKAAQKQGQLS